MTSYDVVIIGGGAAGLLCALQAGHRKRKVLVLDHAQQIGGKILISGGGRCNFTNILTTPDHYVSQNSDFCKSTLSRFTPHHFIQLAQEHNIQFYEKKLGQLFCKHSAKDILNMLMTECHQANVEIKTGVSVKQLSKNHHQFEVSMLAQSFTCTSLVIATGGLSLPKLGATSFGYEIAKQFGLKVTPTDPALDGFILDPAQVPFFSKLSGISLDVTVSCNKKKFRENILFTHRGLSGPAALQASLYWNPGDALTINLLPAVPNLYSWLIERKKAGRTLEIKNALKEFFPDRFSDAFCSSYASKFGPLQAIKNKDLEIFSNSLHAWKIIPINTVGYQKAEVTRGGVDTNELSSKTLESKKVSGLYFIGEVVDVTGQLGGFNFQWAWASGWAAGQVV